MITISNNGRYWHNLGYENVKQKNCIKVKVVDLPLNSNKKILFQCDDCQKIGEREYQLIVRTDVHRCYQCSRKHIGKTMNRTNTDIATKKKNW